MESKYSLLAEEDKIRLRRNALASYHRNKDRINKRRKHKRETDPEFKIKRKQREKRYVSTRRNYHLKKYYGITLEVQQQMYLDQDGKCAICLKRFEDINCGKNTLHVDHDHVTGKVRQLLCGSCNCALGNLNEDILTVNNVLTYLKKWKS